MSVGREITIDSATSSPYNIIIYYYIILYACPYVSDFHSGFCTNAANDRVGVARTMPPAARCTGPIIARDAFSISTYNCNNNPDVVVVVKLFHAFFIIALLLDTALVLCRYFANRDRRRRLHQLQCVP